MKLSQKVRVHTSKTSVCHETFTKSENESTLLKRAFATRRSQKMKNHTSKPSIRHETQKVKIHTPKTIFFNETCQLNNFKPHPVPKKIMSVNYLQRHPYIHTIPKTRFPHRVARAAVTTHFRGWLDAHP